MLQIQNLSASYPSHPVLADVSLHVRPGTLHVLLGRNGCGKSTLLKTVIGALPKTNGHILLNHTPVERIPAKVRAQQLGYLPQTRRMPEMTVRELVECGRYPWLHGNRQFTVNDKKQVEQAMLSAGCAELSDRSAATLSGGELQRACLAMLLSQNATCLLLDEPTAHLDTEAAFSLMALLRRLSHDGRGILCVLHDLPLAMRYADDLTVIDQGHSVFSGAPSELLQSSIPADVFHIHLMKSNADGYYTAPLESSSSL